jgi:hypothetical protein
VVAASLAAYPSVVWIADGLFRADTDVADRPKEGGRRLARYVFPGSRLAPRYL